MSAKRVSFTMDGNLVRTEEGTTLLEAARQHGIHIPTICYLENLSPYGGCRVCLVEIGGGSGDPFLDTSCTHLAREGMVVKTQSPRVVRSRKMIAELLVASSPNVKMAQDIAARMGLYQVRFSMEDNPCILCGLCVRMCSEQMGGNALGFAGRGTERRVSMPFQARPESCLLCRGCDYVCPGVMVPCDGVKSPGELCGRCRPVEEHKCCPNSTFGCFCDKNPL